LNKYFVDNIFIAMAVNWNGAILLIIPSTRVMKLACYY